MTADSLPRVVRGRDRRWTIWCRSAVRWSHWLFRGMGTAAEIAWWEDALTAQYPGLETLILPPGETPVTRVRS